MKTPEDCLFRILRPFDSSGWNALACIAAFMADNKLHAMYTTEQELSGVASAKNIHSLIDESIL